MQFDVVVIGAGAAGMMAAATAGRRGLSVALLDHAEKIGEKIRISGGGRCNFTNVGTGAHAMVGQNPRFAQFALGQYTAQDFIALVKSHSIGFHEKHKGQLFCDDSSQQIIDLLLHECQLGQVQLFYPVSVDTIVSAAQGYELTTSRGLICSRYLVIATGGLSIPKIGATDFGYQIARQFGHKIVETRPSLVPLTFDAAQWQPFVGLSGNSLEVTIKSKSGAQFDEDLLFTHRGLSGPAVLQISNYWQAGEPLAIDLVPQARLAETLVQTKQQSQKTLLNSLAGLMTRTLATQWLQANGLAEAQDKRITEVADKQLRQLGERLNRWELSPTGTEGYKKAEVTRGGVSTEELDQRTMQSKRQPGLYFVGEVVDITGWLGGYNFQWAWSSGTVCGLALESAKHAAQ
jgi:predicted Rossmann fold flavoprotein